MKANQAGHYDTHMEAGTIEQTVYAIYAETWRGTDHVEDHYWNATEDRERAEDQLERFQSQPTTIFGGEHDGKRGVFLNARVVSRTFTVTATDWA